MTDPTHRDAAPPPPTPPGGPARRLPFPATGAGRAAAGVAAAVLVVVAYNLYWAAAAEGLRAGVGQWAAERRAEGVRAGYSALRVEGYPFRLRAVVAAPALSRFRGARPWSWRGPPLTLEARPWRPSRVRVSAPGRHWLVTVAGGRPRELVVDAPELTLKLEYRRGRMARAMLSARRLAVADADGGAVGSVEAADVTVERPVAGAGGPGSGPPLDVVVDADRLVLAQEPVPGLGAETAALRLRAAVTGALPDALGAGGFGRRALARWRDGGGTVEVRRLGVSHGPLTADGEGTVALDRDMQPIGAFTLRLRGFAVALDRLRDAGLIKPHPAALAKAVLQALARPAPGGPGGPDAPGGPGAEGGTVSVPLSLQDRRLYVGPVAVARLPAFRWD